MILRGRKVRKWLRFESRVRLLKIIPDSLVKRLVETYHLDEKARKLTFGTFLRFMVLALTLRNTKPSTRRLARVSQRKIVKALTGLDGISHSSLAAYLNKVSLEALREVLKYLVDVAKTVLPKKTFRWGPLKVADATTIEVSPLLYPWAAPNGDKNAVRLTLVMDPLTWLPLAVIHSSETTNDNTSFERVVNTLRRGYILVVDAGYTKLRCFKEILAKQAHFIAKMTSSYRVVPLHHRRLPKGTRATHQGWTVVDDYRALVGTERSGGPIEARVLVFHRRRKDGTLEERVLWTSLFSATPKQIIRAYLWRWRVEVLFRWLKSELGMEHLPSRSPHGIEAYFLLLLIVWTLFLLFKVLVLKDRSPTLSMRGTRVGRMGGERRTRGIIST